MKILHYALGLPPYRTGGMTKFCLDLMVQQNMDGHQVAMIWPGKIGLINKKISVIDRGSAILKEKEINIHNFEIINPLPISYDEGIKQFDVFMYDAGKEIYRQFLDDFQPDILHVHTLMGLHKSLIAASKEKGIRLVYTAHDFFPVCPKVTMFRNGEICRTADSCEECSACNSTALGIKKMQMLQSPLYRRLKDNAVVRKMRKRHRDNYLKENSQAREGGAVGTAADYKKLRKYYISLLGFMDMIHYNSSVTKRVYEAYIGWRNSCVIGISHADIMDCKKIKEFSKDLLRIRYLGPCGGAKGFFYLRRHWINYGMKTRISV